MIPSQRFVATLLEEEGGGMLRFRFENGREFSIAQSDIWGPTKPLTQELALIVGEPVTLEVNGWWWHKHRDELPEPK